MIGTRLADTLILASRLAAAGTRLTAGRLRRSSGLGGPALPTDVASLDPATLTRLLAPRHPSVRVTNVRVVATEAGTTDRARLELASEGTPVETLPAHLFVKLAPRDTATRLFVTMMGLGANEVRFYDELRDRVAVRTPRAHVAVADPLSGDFVLVLDDLAAAGCSFASAAEPCTLATAQAMMRTLAALHAPWWDAAVLTRRFEWMRAPARHRSVPLERAISALGMRRGVARFPDLVPETLRAATALLRDERARLEHAWSQPPLTVLHGDAHVGNTFADGETVGLVDWQVTQQGQGMRDVTYFLCNSLPTELRRAHERDLIALYLDTLARAGTSGLGANVAWEQYRLHSLYAWISAAFTAGLATLQRDAIVRTALGRAAHAVIDLDALAALAALSRRASRSDRTEPW